MQALENRKSFTKRTFKYSSPGAEPASKTYPSELLPQSDIAELFFCVWQSHQMSAANRQRLNFALLSYDRLNESDYRLINRILHAVKRGWIKMID